VGGVVVVGFYEFVSENLGKCKSNVVEVIKCLFFPLGNKNA
jgi:hypothetical protein